MYLITDYMMMMVVRDSDGGLLFCWSKRQTTGMLLTVDQIHSWINSRTQKRKKREKGMQTEKDIEQERQIQEATAE